MSEIEFLRAWFAEFGAEPVKTPQLYEVADKAGVSDAKMSEKGKQSAIGWKLNRMLDTAYDGGDGYIYSLERVSRKYPPAVWKLSRKESGDEEADNAGGKKYVSGDTAHYVRITVDCLPSQVQQIVDFFDSLKLYTKISAKA
jgi:hypothetical protein